MASFVADLHLHSTCSDGLLAPEALVDAAAEAGLAAIALTDHDTLGGLERAAARGRERGVEVIPGCELTVYVGRTELHLLALFLSLEASAPLPGLLENLRAKRRARVFQMAAQLRAAGFTIEDADILEAAGSAESLGRPHVAAALVRRGNAHDQRAAQRFLREGAPGYVPKLQFEPLDAIRAVHASGGIAVLAHPGIEPHDELIPSFCARGLDGLEVFHPQHSAVNRRYYTALAERYEVGVSGGSDFHGPSVRAGLSVGCAGVTAGQLSDLRRRVSLRRA